MKVCLCLHLRLNQSINQLINHWVDQPGNQSCNLLHSHVPTVCLHCFEVTLNTDLVGAVSCGWGAVPQEGVVGRDARKLTILRTLGGPEL